MPKWLSYGCENNPAHLISVRNFDLFKPSGASKKMKVGDKFAVTKCMPGLETNWNGETHLWNPLLYAIDLEMIEIAKLLIEISAQRVPQYIGLCFREFINSEAKFDQDNWKNDQRNYGLYITLATQNVKLLDYVMNDHYYLWDKESLLTSCSLPKPDKARSCFQAFIVSYMKSLSEEEQIQLVQEILTSSRYDKEMTKALMNSQTAPQLLVYNIKKKDFEAKLNLDCLEISKPQAFVDFLPIINQ